MQTYTHSYINLYLRQSRDPTGVVNTLLEYPLLELVASGKSDCLEYEKAASFYERLALFIGRVNDSHTALQDIDQEKAYQRTLGTNILQCGIPSKIANAILEIQKYHARKRSISMNIVTNDPALASVPWELIGASNVANSIGLNPFCVTRFVENGKNVGDDILADPTNLRIMLVSAQPIDRDSPNPDLEFAEIIKQLDKRKHFPIEIHPFDHSEYLDFVDNLQAINPTTLHIALHGTPEGIYFQRGESHQLIPYSSLVNDIKQIPNLLLVVLSVCYSAYSVEHVSYPSFAQALVESGIPAVIGMASQFTPRASVEFSKRLYAELSKGYPVIQGYDRAIDTLRNHPHYDSLEWSIPMYYHSANVVVFPTVWENNARLKRRPKINFALLSKVKNLSQEAINVLEDLRPNAGWGLEQWDVETIPFRLLLQQLKSGIRGLENMDTAHDTESMNWIFLIRDNAQSLDLALDEIEQNINRLLDETISPRERRSAVEELDQNRMTVIQNLYDLLDTLN